MPASTVGFQRLPHALRDALSAASQAVADGSRELHEHVLRDEHALAAGAIQAHRDAQRTRVAAVHAPRRLRFSDEDRAMLSAAASALGDVMEQLEQLVFASVGARACRDLPTLTSLVRDAGRELGRVADALERDPEKLQRSHERIEGLRDDARRQIRASRAGALQCGDPLQTLRCHDAFDAVDDVYKAALAAVRALQSLDLRFQ